MKKRLASTLAVLLTATLSGTTASAGADTIVLQTMLQAGQFGYTYLPFQMPDGVRRIDVQATLLSGDARFGIGIFDQRGSQFQSAGFRGVFGEERKTFFIEGDEATESFIPGPLDAGEWTVMIATFTSSQDSDVEVTISPTFGAIDPTPTSKLAKPPSKKRGWYTGDLHNHSTHSSDAYSQAGSVTPAQLANVARKKGLDFVSLTDHNVVSQNLDLRDDSNTDVLLIGGEEVTNWFFGHATATGMPPGAWLDFRQRPAGLELGPGEGRAAEMFARAEELGTYTAVAHPHQFGQGNTWSFFDEIEAGAIPDGIELWNGSVSANANLQAIGTWDSLLQEGYRIWGSGGSDSHGLEGADRAQPGGPATRVYATKLSQPAIVEALNAGRMYVTASPKGPTLVFVVAKGDRRVMSGGTIAGAGTFKACVKVRKPRSMKLSDWKDAELALWRDGTVVATRPMKKEAATFRFRQQADAPGYLRVELIVGDPGGNRTLLALSNPIFLEPEGQDQQSPAPGKPAC